MILHGELEARAHGDVRLGRGHEVRALGAQVVELADQVALRVVADDGTAEPVVGGGHAREGAERLAQLAQLVREEARAGPGVGALRDVDVAHELAREEELPDAREVGITSHVAGKSMPSQRSRWPARPISTTLRGIWQMYDWKYASPRMISSRSPPPSTPTGSMPAASITSRGA